jgi:hypothetical protein
MTLTEKAEQAIITRLRQHPALSKVSFHQQESEDVKTYGTVVVACQQGEEDAPPSGVYAVEAEITLLYPIRRPAGDSVSDYKAKRGAVEEVLNVHWKQLSAELTAAREDWHCYDIRLNGINNQPTDKAYQSVYTCKLVAMGQTFLAAANLKPVL